MIFLAAQPIVDILEEHSDELAWLLERRAQAIRSPDYRPRDLRLLDARIAAHLDALVLAGHDVEPLLVDRLENAEEPALIAGAAFALVHGEDPKQDPKVDLAPLIEALCAAPVEVVRAVALALSLARPTAARDGLAAVARSGPPRAAALASLALAGQTDVVVTARLPSLLGDGDALVRESGWAVLAGLTWGGRPWADVPPAPAWTAALRADCESDEPALRQAALVAAVMTRQPFLLPWALEKASTGARADLPVADLGAALATPADAPVFLRLLARQELGPGRFEVAASSGAPKLVEALLDGMASPEPDVCLPASAAFHRITGSGIATDGILRVPADGGAGAAEIDDDLSEEVPRPDAERTRAQWRETGGGVASAPRLYLGVPLPQTGVAAAQQVTLDMRALWQDLLRASYHGAAPAAHEDFWNALRPLD